MEASQTGGDQQDRDPAADALEGGDPSQEAAASQLTEEQRAQAESGNATQGEQAGEVPSQDAAPTGAGFDPNQPVRTSPATPDETRQAAEAGRTAAPNAQGERNPEAARREVEEREREGE